MKKIFLSCAVAVTALLSSCNMELTPAGAISEDQAVETVNDCQRFRAGFYTVFRSNALSTTQLVLPELQADCFQAVSPLYGNYAGEFFTGKITSATSEFESVWLSLYRNIGTINFYLPRAQKLIDEGGLSAAQKSQIELTIGEAYFFRAFYNYRLFDLYCQSWSEELKDKPALGVPLITVYYPTADRSKYIGRSTMAETFAAIYDDLAKAEAAVKANEADGAAIVPGANYLNSMIITAFRARLALLQGHKADAVKYAQEVINSGYYELCQPADYASIWLADDPLKEVIMQPFVDATEAAGLGAYGASYWTKTSGTSAWYIPSNATLTMYKKLTDVRYGVFFENKELEIEGQNISTPCFVKFPGNMAYAADKSAKGVNAPKPFRLAEMYLIVAECGDNATANQALNDLRKARTKLPKTYKDTQYTDAELVSEVRLERAKELIGEGFRLSDLRRWKQGFKRDSSTPKGTWASNDFGSKYFVQIYMDLEIPAGDKIFTWPIPSKEIQVNPQIVGQQNPGY